MSALSTPSRRTDALGIVALLLVVFATRWAFRYHDGFGDVNVVQMAAGMARGASGDASFGDTLVYGKNFSLGVYVAFWTTYRPLFDDATHVIAFLNWVGWIGATLLFWPAYVLFRRSMRPTVAIASLCVMAFTPVVWEMGTSFQPMTLAFGMLLLAVLAFDRVEASARGAAFFVLTTLCALAAVLARAEIVLVAPGLLLACLTSEQPRRRTSAFIATTAIVAVVTLALLLLVAGREQAAGQGLGTYLERFVDLYVRPRKVPYNLVWAALGTGIVTLVALITGLARRGLRVDGERREVAVAAGWALPVLLFWMWNPVPLVRHYFLLVPALVWLCGRTLFEGRSTKLVVVVASMLVVGNLLVPELLYGVVDRASAAPKEPHGSFFAAHAANQDRITRARELCRRVLENLPPAGGDAPGLLVQVDREGFAYLEYVLTVWPHGLVQVRDEEEQGALHVREYARDGWRLRAIETSWDFLPDVRRVLDQEIERASERGDRILRQGS